MPEKMPEKLLSEIALEAIKKIQQPLLLYGIIESILLISLLIFGSAVPKGLLPIVYVLAVLIVIIAMSHFTLEFVKQRVDIESAQARGPGRRVIAGRSDSAELLMHVESLVKEAHRFVLIGTGLNILQRDTFAVDVMKRAAYGHLDLEIYLANGNSPDIETRLVEEELGDIKPPVSQGGLSKHLEKLLRIWKDVQFSSRISINLFTNYPTFALLIIDDEYLVYPYGFATLGNFSPVFRFSRSNQHNRSAIEFLERQYRLIKAHSQDARTVQMIGNNELTATSNLYPLALYFIPPKESSLYRFGTDILGYDIRESQFKPSLWTDAVGEASDYGFHLTVCDVLYFLSESDAEMAKAEIEFLAQNFDPFEITDLHVKPHFPDASSISIALDDPSGSLEALHCEFVHRVYRRAAASNYTIGHAKLDRDRDHQRAKLMISKYHAPYILQRFRPHFSLLTNVTKDSASKIFMDLEKDFSSRVEDRKVSVDKLAIMTRPKIDAPWKIEKEIKLGERH